jgi:glycosyltransferase involved in cell wall biosynthesis
VTQPVVIDVTRLIGRYLTGRHPTGVDRVNLAYLAYYATHAQGLLRLRWVSAFLPNKVVQTVAMKLQKWSWTSALQVCSWVIYGVVSNLGRGCHRHAFLLHAGHNGVESDSLWRMIEKYQLRPIFFLHDLIPITHPQFCREREKDRHIRRVDCMLRSAGVIANSGYTLSELKAYAEQKGFTSPATCVALLAPPALLASGSTNGSVTQATLNSFEKQAQHPIIASLMANQTPFFVVVGTIEPRKNHALLLDVWRSLVSADIEGPIPHLVIIGQEGWMCSDIVEQLREKSIFEGTVHWIERCDDKQMFACLRESRALLFPSYVEGFGMPLAEALALGVPVIASDLSVFHEFGADVPCYLPPTDVQAWRKEVLDYARVQSLSRQAQSARRQALQLPTWHQHFVIVDAFLGRINQTAPSDTEHRLQQWIPALEQGVTRATSFKNFSIRKKIILQRYLNAMRWTSPGVEFVWGGGGKDDLHKPYSVRVEDGFIRSVGLGADLIKPLSWVFDIRGIYFDATRPSDLEWLLQNTVYSEDKLARAALLRSRIVKSGLSKYNLFGTQWHRPAQAKWVILVAGQVESDASIVLGAVDIKTNLQLLEAVRRDRPNAYIVYKPHPDVVARLRSGGSVDNAANETGQKWFDEVIEQADMAQLLGQVDEVHVITSLTGFEAILRNVPVTVYGAPFYAGWGLCNEPHLPQAVRVRRKRRLSVEELVASTLMDYAVYLHPNRDELMTPEQALQHLELQRKDRAPIGAYPNWRRRSLAVWAKFRNQY